MDTNASVSEVSANVSIRKGSNRMCCVVSCLNSERKNPELQFYRFPGFAWEVERKKKWIASVRRETIDKKPWVPTKNSRICSVHFAGGEKSNDPRKEAYNPTIFPAIYKKKNSDSKRAQRLETRLKQKEKTKKQIDEAPSKLETHMEISIGSDFRVPNNKSEIGVQTDPDFEQNSQPEANFLFCSMDGKNASTQTLIDVRNSWKQRKPEKIIVATLEPAALKTCTTAVGPDCKMQGTFMGFSNIGTDELMKKFGGIDLVFFGILVKFILPKNDGQPTYFKKLSAQNRLLLFLMKIKHGLPYDVLACLFDVSRITASRVFESVLQTLISKTKTWLFWPSREAIRETMPQNFGNYPNCRAIIDCIEIRCDTPPTTEQRIFMYSHEKSCFTIKFLIAISPCGLITFVSKMYGGKASDEFIINDSGFLNMIEPGDQIMADKDFPEIRGELLKRQCTLAMTPFALNPPFTGEEVTENCSISSVRKNIERAIQRVKIFKILNQINIELLSNIDYVIFMACILANNTELPFK